MRSSLKIEATNDLVELLYPNLSQGETIQICNKLTVAEIIKLKRAILAQGTREHTEIFEPRAE